MARIIGPRIVTNGLVMCLDAANTKSYPGSGTAWTDLSRSFNTTLTNGPTFTSSLPNYFTFDGANDFVAIGTDSSLTPANFTNSVWVYPISVSGSGSIIVRSRTYGYIIRLVVGPIFTMSVYTSINDSLTHTISSNTISLNTWYNVVQTFSGSVHSMYINGQFVTSTATSGANAYYAGSQYLALARDGDASSYYFNGRIACFQFYNRGLTAAEVAQNFNALRGRFGI